MTTEQLRLRAAPSRVPLSLPKLDGGTALLGFGALVIAVIVGKETWAYRPLFAGIVLVILLGTSMKWPRLGVILTFIYLPLMALVRRLLIEPSGWTTTDPLLMVGPIVALFLIYRVVLAEKRPLGGDTLSKLVLVLFGFAIVEAVNPSGNGPLAGILGLLFIAVPLLWFFIGRSLCTPSMALTVVNVAVVVAALVAGYGIWQTQTGFPSWDVAWINVGGYASLHVGGTNSVFGTNTDVIRPFGTFASAREYGTYLDVGLVFAVALALHRRYIALLTVPLLGWAIVLSSGRSVLVLGLLGVVVVMGMRTRSISGLLVTLVLGVGMLFAVVTVFGGSLDRASKGNNPLVSHQVGGLLNPLDPQQSTLLGHIGQIKTGIVDGVKDPIGKGTGVTNRAASVAGGASNDTSEVDISDAFISLGLVGGFIFLGIIIVTFRRAFSAYVTRGDPAILAAVGLFVVMLGQWLNGGLYAVSPLTWFFVGWIAALTARSAVRARSSAPPERLPSLR